MSLRHRYLLGCLPGRMYFRWLPSKSAMSDIPAIQRNDEGSVRSLERSPKPPFALSIQMPEMAGKRTCRSEIMENLRAIDTIRSHDPHVDRCCSEHAEYGRNEVDPD